MPQPLSSEPRQEPREPVVAPSISSRELLGSGRELIILHGQERYRLQLTKSSKLILTK